MRNCEKVGSAFVIMGRDHLFVDIEEMSIKDRALVVVDRGYPIACQYNIGYGENDLDTKGAQFLMENWIAYLRESRECLRDIMEEVQDLHAEEEDSEVSEESFPLWGGALSRETVERAFKLVGV